MIQFTKGQSNTLTLTLTENSTLTNPIYLFQFNNQQTNVDYYFIANDTSQYKERYNRFVIASGTDTLNAEIELGNEGFYNYYVYETNLANTSGLSNAEDAVPYIVGQVENGLVWVLPEADAIINYEPDDDTAVAYEPVEFDYLVQENDAYILQEDGYLIQL
jgi:hypothetical protein